MFKLLFIAGLALAAPAARADDLHTIDLPVRRTFARSTGEVNGPALLRSLQNTLNKYHSKSNHRGASARASLRRRLVTENLLDQVEDPDFDEQYYGPIEVGYRSTEQIFTVQFDTGSSDLFIPGPQCTSNEGCPFNKKYDQGGVYRGQTTVVQYGSGYVQGDDFTDSVNVAGLTATNQGLISLTQATGFNTSSSDGLLGMGFTALAASGFTTFFENLMSQNKVGTYSRGVHFHLWTASGKNPPLFPQQRKNLPNPLQKSPLPPLTEKATANPPFQKPPQNSASTSAAGTRPATRAPSSPSPSPKPPTGNSPSTPSTSAAAPPAPTRPARSSSTRAPRSSWPPRPPPTPSSSSCRLLFPSPIRLPPRTTTATTAPRSSSSSRTRAPRPRRTSPRCSLRADRLRLRRWISISGC